MNRVDEHKITYLKSKCPDFFWKPVVVFKLKKFNALVLSRRPGVRDWENHIDREKESVSDECENANERTKEREEDRAGDRDREAEAKVETEAGCT